MYAIRSYYDDSFTQSEQHTLIEDFAPVIVHELSARQRFTQNMMLAKESALKKLYLTEKQGFDSFVTHRKVFHNHELIRKIGFVITSYSIHYTKLYDHEDDVAAYTRRIITLVDGTIHTDQKISKSFAS